MPNNWLASVCNGCHAHAVLSGTRHFALAGVGNDKRYLKYRFKWQCRRIIIVAIIIYIYMSISCGKKSHNIIIIILYICMYFISIGRAKCNECLGSCTRTSIYICITHITMIIFENFEWVVAIQYPHCDC